MSSLVVGRMLQCPKNWAFYRPSKRCYLVVQKPMNFKEAQQYCSEFGRESSLLKVEDEEQNSFIKSQFPNSCRHNCLLFFKYYSRNVLELNNGGSVWLSAEAVFDIIAADAGLNYPGFVLRWPTKGKHQLPLTSDYQVNTEKQNFCRTGSQRRCS